MKDESIIENGQLYQPDRAIEIRNRLSTANENIKYIDVHGKEYAEVKERIKVFRYAFPEGSIATKLISLDENKCVFKAEVFNENGSLLSSGHAQETIASVKFKDSLLEVAETSAVGRALGFLGLGIKNAVASSDEVKRSGETEELRNKMLLCHRCNHQIIDTEDKSGKIWKASEISEITVNYYGDSLCFRCLRELKAQKTEIEV